MDAPGAGQTVYVVATTPEGTTDALRDAHRTTPDDRIVLLVPILMAERPAVREFAAVIDVYARLARAAGVPATPYACVCRHPEDVAAWFQVGRSTIVVGGARAAWPLESPEERLVHALRREGHDVRFVPVPARETRGTSADLA